MIDTAMINTVRKTCVVRQAPGKVNLFLRVVCRRPDGFHELETVMARLPGVADTLLVESLPTDQLELRIVAAGPRTLATEPLTVSNDNLVLRAARKLKEHVGRPLGAQLTLIKRIPATAGLGGGSSDAATTLLALNEAWELSLDSTVLHRLSSELGSDVPFFLADSAWVLCTGRGEVLKALSVSGRFPLVVARPRSGLSTPAVFRVCQPEPAGPSVESFIDSLRSPGSGRLARTLHNTLQVPAEGLNADLRSLKQLFERENVVAHQMTGSGSAYFAICHSFRQACCIAARLRQAGIPWVQVSPAGA